MRILQSEWSKRLTGALERLKACTHPFARVVHRLVTGQARYKGKQVILLPMAKIAKADFCDYVASYNNCNKKKLSYAYPPTEKTLSVLRKDMEGILYGSKVYVSESLKDPDQIAVVLIHEIAHFVRQDLESYDSPESIFREEFAAHFTEELVWSNERMTRLKLREIAQKVSDLYDTSMPDKISLPDCAPLDTAVKHLVLKK